MPIEPRNSRWIVFPDTQSRFLGYWTKDDPSRNPDLTAPGGQNTTPNQGDRISIRNYGYQLFPATATFATAAVPTSSIWTFHRRDGSQVFMCAQGADLKFFDEDIQQYVVLETGYTSADFGGTEMNVNTDGVSWYYFGNGVEDASRWNGAYTHLTGALLGGEATINVTTTLDFNATGTLKIGGTSVNYTGQTATSFTGCTGTPAAASGATVCQAVQTYASHPKGNIYTAADNRLFIAGISATPQAIYFSRYGDATNFVGASLVTQSTATSAGIFNLVEGGGPVTAMAMDERSIYFFKENIIYSATLTDTLYTLVPLKPFDGKSQTTGAKSKRSVFVGGNRVFFVSKDNQIYSLQRVETIDYPQMVPISQPIQPTVDGLDFSSLSGIVYSINAYFACKKSPGSVMNDVMLRFNMNNGTWDTPVIDFNISDFAVYKINGKEELLFGDAGTSNVWQVTSGPKDYIYPVIASWPTKQYDFGAENTLKELDAVFVEGYIDDNTTLNITLYLDDNGYTQTITTAFDGTETQYLFNTTTLNTFGLTPFGAQVFGSNDDPTGRKKFRIFLNENIRRIPFFTAQLEFVSSGVNQQWEVIRYGFLVRAHSQPIPTALMRSW